MIEIERKFLVRPEQWPRCDTPVQITQGYMVRHDGLVVRVRQKDEDYFLSVKARIDTQTSYDFEYPIPAEDALIMFEKICVDSIIRKSRHCVPHGELLWEIDEFHGDNHGLVVAEIELPDADIALDLPAWITDEVTAEARYRNASLAKRPFRSWPD